MTKTQSKGKKIQKPDPRALRINNRFLTASDVERLRDASEEDFDAFQDEVTARVANMPECRAAGIIQKFQGDSVDINATADDLMRLVADVQRGDMKNPEAMLVSQAHALDTLFANLARRSHSNMDAGYLDAADRYLRLALRAQAQAVKTIEALSELKSPKQIAFVRQANIANNQQVNNGESFQTSTRECAPGRENENQQSKLSAGANYELCQNAGASSIAGAINPAMEAVGEVDRTANG